MEKTYLISGAGTGIGQAIARELAAQDTTTRVILLGRKRDPLEAARSRLPRPDSHLCIAADVRNGHALRNAFKEIRLEDLNLCGVIANAGLGGENHYGPEDRWDEIIGTNLTGAYILVNEALPALRRGSSSYRHIVLISSILARQGVAHYAAYCASKAGLLGLMRSWAVELAPEKILVNAICPSWVETEMATQGIQNIARAMNTTAEQARVSVLSSVPLGRMTEPREIGELVKYLCGPNQASITGQSLDINCGSLMP